MVTMQIPKRSKFPILLNCLLGFATFVLFGFLFPKGAVPTIMHDILPLPGPGAGIGMIYAQLLVTGLVLSILLVKKEKAVFPPALLSSTIVSALVLLFSLFRIAEFTHVLGRPYLSAAAILFCGIVVEISTYLLDKKRLRSFFSILTMQASGSVSCLAFYWFFIFPRVSVRSIPPLNVVNATIILAVTLVSSIIFSVMIRVGVAHYSS